MTEQNKFTEFTDSIIPEEYKNSKVYAVMLFMTEMEMGISQIPNKWINTKNYRFNNGQDALDFYANTPCSASQLIDANSEEELVSKMNEMILNYQNEQWLQDNLYPYL